MRVELHRGDLPAGLALGDCVAIDTETMGLAFERDRLCLAQLSSGDGVCHLVQFAHPQRQPDAYAAPRLKALLSDKSVLKLFHFARFDLATLRRHVGVMAEPVYCTKVAARLVRTFTDRHGLKDLCKELLGVELSKQQQTSDWGAPELSREQLDYAAADVAHLHALKRKLDELLEREGRTELAGGCFRFLPYRAALDLAGWGGEDIFEH
jgi:ribonuclease D